MDFWRRSVTTSRLERKTNVQIRARVGVKTNIIKTIEKKRLQWYEHVLRLNTSSIPQLVMNRILRGENREKDERINSYETWYKVK